jgi:NAD(P)-dependent dehydrogenase (short-subunit alcohol dehydrogenase family)
MSDAVPTMLVDRLAGTTVLVTGVTGFVGEALLHRLLSQVPDITIAPLVRPKGSTTGADRIAAMLAKPIFSDVVEAAGGVEEVLRRRIRVVEGDLSDVPALPADLDAVVHCAGDVSFDPPVDEAFATNVVGTRHLLQRVAEVGHHVHYVHISTAYVAGRRRGVIPEGSVDHDIDLEAELAWGIGQRQVIEDRSRAVDMLGGAAGPRPSGTTAAPGRSPPPPRRRTAAGPGYASSSSAPERSGRGAWAGPTATRSPRRSASGWSRSTPGTRP